MKKPNCRRTDEEKRVHDKAVFLRKMTDEQLVNKFYNATNEYYAVGFDDAKNYVKALLQAIEEVCRELDGIPILEEKISKINRILGKVKIGEGEQNA